MLEVVAARDAATLVLVRDAFAGGIEVFCVVRHSKSAFLGGAVVFPGGKVDPSDYDDAWEQVSTPYEARGFARAFAVAACREALEEAALLPLDGRLGHGELLALRAEVGAGKSLRELLRARGLRVDLQRLHALSRWVTPSSEPRRFDTRNFLTTASADEVGAHDEHETTASFWARPDDILARYARRELQLSPPTLVTLWELGRDLARVANVQALLVRVQTACLDPIEPKLVRDGDTMALVLPGDPEHDVNEVRTLETTRVVLRDGLWSPVRVAG
jgi:8-oxo-dGTP pyrophosphatase MutT (NUDIX family)